MVIFIIITMIMFISFYPKHGSHIRDKGQSGIKTVKLSY